MREEDIPTIHQAAMRLSEGYDLDGLHKVHGLTDITLDRKMHGGCVVRLELDGRYCGIYRLDFRWRHGELQNVVGEVLTALSLLEPQR